MLNGAETVRYVEVITGNDIKTALSNTDIGTVMYQYGFKENMLDELDLSKYELKISIWVSDDHYPVRCEIDMTDLFSTIIDHDASEEQYSVSHKIASVLFRVDYTEFNTLDDIVIPEDALNQEITFTYAGD